LLGNEVVQISLDYYRILGLPVQATDEQLQQAYHDRALQLPKREFSDRAIAARKSLLDQAYAVLSEPASRVAYDASFVPQLLEVHGEGSDLTLDLELPPDPELSPELNLDTDSALASPTSSSPTLEITISEEQFAGALLILLELGEYELVLELGRPRCAFPGLKQFQLTKPQPVQPDVLLAVAIACLELGREQWQQGQFEVAAHTLETGQELLQRQGLFTQLNAELQTDLLKLRPYRILEIFALPEIEANERYGGLQLLQAEGRIFPV
jgi:curved DNA-binding protein CbpA